MSNGNIEVQGPEIAYRLHTLGWKAFQDLCNVVIAEVLGQTVQSFLSSRDGGRDGAFQGIWSQGDGAALTGSFVIQCKFSARENATLRMAHLADELTKAAQLAQRGLADNYLLITNMGVSGAADEEIRARFTAVEGIKSCQVFGADWLTLQIRQSPRLRMLVPRIYGLGDLSQILDLRAYHQAAALLAGLGDDFAKFVTTDAFRRSVSALAEHHFVILLGDPASGKSTIAAALALGALDRWQLPTLRVRSADEFIQHWNPHEPKQFFWIDDVFGATQYNRELATEWTRGFDYLRTAVQKGARVVFTSRTYIYQAALRDLKTSTFPLLGESQVVVQVEQLTTTEKSQMLYNHLRLGRQPPQFRARIKTLLPKAVESKRFLPESARRLGDPLFTGTLDFSENAVRRFFDNPIDILVEVVRTLGRVNQAALILMFMDGGRLESPIVMTEGKKGALRLLGTSEGDVINALPTLEGSLVRREQQLGTIFWRFRHPTVREAVAQIVAENPELCDVYLAGTAVGTILNEVSCGGVGVEGVKVVVPASRYDALIRRLPEAKGSGQVDLFLASRCDREFLKMYLEVFPDSWRRICRPGSYLSAASSPFLIARLKELDLFPSERQEELVDCVADLACSVPDADFLEDKRLRGLFTDQDIDAIMERVRVELLPNLAETVDEWRSNYNSEGGDPALFFEDLENALDVFDRATFGEASARLAIANAKSRIVLAVGEILEEYPPAPEDDDEYGGGAAGPGAPDDSRSVFDDVDV